MKWSIIDSGVSAIMICLLALDTNLGIDGTMNWIFIIYFVSRVSLILFMKLKTECVVEKTFKEQWSAILTWTATCIGFVAAVVDCF